MFGTALSASYNVLTVAILAQGTSWAVAATQAFFFTLQSLGGTVNLYCHVCFPFAEVMKTTPVGFEPTRGDPIGLAGRRLNRSAKVSLRAISKYSDLCNPGSHACRLGKQPQREACAAPRNFSKCGKDQVQRLRNKSRGCKEQMGRVLF